MTITPDDRGFTLGDGLFETVLVEDGALVDWQAHVARLATGCAALGLPAPEEERLLLAARQALEARRYGTRGVLRISWSAGPGGRGLDRPPELAPNLVVTTHPAPVSLSAARLSTSAIRRNESSPSSRHKTLNYLDNVLARQEAVRAGADEALMLNSRGEVACATAANVFWMADGVLFTPALECGVLAGTVRARIAQIFEVSEVFQPLSALDRADAILLTNSIAGVRDVCELDGRPLPQQVGQSILKALRGRR